MAASISDENNTSSKSKDDLSAAEIMLGDDWAVDSDTSDPIAESDQLSLFCRNCLSPYEGEEMHSGNFVLRCKNCDHRDVIPAEELNDTVYTKEPKLLEGDLLNNRFNMVLKAQEKLKEIDVQNPDYIDDQYRKYYYLHPKIYALMNTCIKDMHAVVDGHRKDHNDKMIDKIIERRVKLSEEGQKDEGEMVEVMGSTQNNTLIIYPDEFVVPDSVKIKCFRIGKVGIRNADKMILENGIPNDSIETMPMFKTRVELYKGREAMAGSESNDATEVGFVRKSRANRGRNKNNKGNEKSLDNNQNITRDDKSVQHPKLNENEASRATEDDNMTVRSESEDSANNEADNISKKKCKKKKGRPTIKQAKNSDAEEEKSRILKLSTERFLENLPAQKARPLTPEEVKMYDEQRKISEYILQDLDEVEDLNDFVMEKVNDAFKEIVSALTKLREEALTERREQTIKYIEKTVAGMSEQVDVVRDEVINELRDAYKSKMVRTNKQKKQLEEAKERVEGYGKLLRHYHETGQDDKLDALLEELSNENCEN